MGVVNCDHPVAAYAYAVAVPLVDGALLAEAVGPAEFWLPDGAAPEPVALACGAAESLADAPSLALGDADEALAAVLEEDVLGDVDDDAEELRSEGVWLGAACCVVDDADDCATVAFCDPPSWPFPHAASASVSRPAAVRAGTVRMSSPCRRTVPTRHAVPHLHCGRDGGRGEGAMPTETTRLKPVPGSPIRSRHRWPLSAAMRDSSLPTRASSSLEFSALTGRTSIEIVAPPARERSSSSFAANGELLPGE